MNLSKLFEFQRKLDAEIEEKHPTLPGEDRLAKRMLALQVELGECANEWRGFKFWSTNQEARISEWHSFTNPMRGEGGFITNPLLEEYVDCLHFALSIGNNIEMNKETFNGLIRSHRLKDVVDQFMWVNKKLTNFYQDCRDNEGKFASFHYLHFFDALLGLGEMLGFTWEQVETAYLEKNKTNWERQANGY